MISDRKSTLKVGKKISKNTAKIALKLGDIVKNHQQEFEVNLDSSEFIPAISFLEHLDLTDEVQYTTQSRINYQYKKDFYFSVKWSKYYEHHYELESIIDDPNDIPSTKKKLHDIAESLGLPVVSESEFGEFLAYVDNKHKEDLKKTPPLYVLAYKKNLPTHQYMDTDTLHWINITSENHVPNTGQSYPLLLKDEEIDLLTKFFPEKKDFLSPEQSGTIHGIAHISRVVLYTMLICKLLTIKENDQKLYLTIAKNHDIRRIDDKADNGHGIRAWEWFSKKTPKETANYNSFSKGELDSLKKAIIFHEVDYSDIKETLTPENSLALDIIKAADALDRYRLPKEKWWPNVKYIKLQKAHTLLPLCRKITLESEDLILSGIDAKSAIISVLRDNISRI